MNWMNWIPQLKQYSKKLMSKSNTDHWNFQVSMHIKCNLKIGCFICNNMDECQKHQAAWKNQKTDKREFWSTEVDSGSVFIQKIWIVC